MNIFIKLINLDDALPALFNVDHILTIRTIDSTQSEVLVSDGTVFNVNHSLQDIMNLMDPFNR